MSVLLSWICLNSYAQLPHPNDTLENGKKVPFNQFMGRFSVFNDLGGAAYYYSLNVGYSVFKSDLASIDITLGANRVQYGQYGWKEGVVNGFFIPVGISSYIGRRKSRFNLRAGYSPQVFSQLLSTKKLDDCSGCSLVEQRFFFSVGYTYQNPYGFFLGVNANLLLQIWSQAERDFFPGKVGYQPWPGLVLGYRLPSKQRHNEWRERGFKKRVLRLEDKKEKQQEAYNDIDRVFYKDEPLEVDSADMKEIEAKLAKLKRQHERYLKEEQRLNGRSLVYAEFFGATGIASVNYTYTHPIARSKIFMMEYRGGFGADRHNLQLPVHVGFKAMKNYRGTGVFLGVVPQYNPRTGSFGAVYFLEHNVEFHFAYGITGGVAFYLFYDPSYYKNQWNFSPYGGFFLGYRLPQMKRDKTKEAP
ncbi:MAG: hypothetical protein GC178_01325 [Flavobacteriales bacterium]|nr:hypothetical protein [Flavobacteriales bacterium]